VVCETHYQEKGPKGGKMVGPVQHRSKNQNGRSLTMEQKNKRVAAEAREMEVKHTPRKRRDQNL